MITVIIWALLLGIFFYMFGAGGFFVGFSGAVLVIAFIAGSIGIILNIKTPNEVISTILMGAFLAGFLPALLAGALRDVWRTLSPATVFFIGVVIIGAAILLSRERR